MIFGKVKLKKESKVEEQKNNLRKTNEILNKIQSQIKSLGYYLYKLDSKEMEKNVNMLYAKQVLNDIQSYISKENTNIKRDLFKEVSSSSKEEYFKKLSTINSPNEDSINRIGKILNVKKELLKEAVKKAQIKIASLEKGKNESEHKK